MEEERENEYEDANVSLFFYSEQISQACAREEGGAIQGY